jgi:hypothetical protein
LLRWLIWSHPEATGAGDLAPPERAGGSVLVAEKIKKNICLLTLQMIDKHKVVCYSIITINRGGTIMNEIEIVKALMKAKGVSGAVLADKLGYKTPSAVTNRLQSKTMTVEVLISLLGAMDCELIIKNKVGGKESFVVENENRNEVKIYKKKDGEAE